MTNKTYQIPDFADLLITLGTFEDEYGNEKTFNHKDYQDNVNRAIKLNGSIKKWLTFKKFFVVIF